VSEDRELVGKIPARIWMKIDEADLIPELIEALKRHDPQYQFDVIEFCVAHKLSVTADDFSNIRAGYKQVKKPFKLKERIIESKFFPRTRWSVGNKAWGSSLTISKAVRKPPSLKEDRRPSKYDLENFPSRKTRGKPASGYSGSVGT
jgi:hypothetical protein